MTVRVPAETPAWRAAFDPAAAQPRSRRRRFVYRFDQRLRVNRGPLAWVYLATGGPQWFRASGAAAVEIRDELRANRTP